MLARLQFAGDDHFDEDQARGTDAWDEHAELIQAISRRSARRAGELMRRHTERTREIYHDRRQAAAEVVA